MKIVTITATTTGALIKCYLCTENEMRKNFTIYMSIADQIRSPVQLHLARPLCNMFPFVFVCFAISSAFFFVTCSAFLFFLCIAHTHNINGQNYPSVETIEWKHRMYLLFLFRTITLNWTRCWQTLRKSWEIFEMHFAACNQNFLFSCALFPSLTWSTSLCFLFFCFFFYILFSLFTHTIQLRHFLLFHSLIVSIFIVDVFVFVCEC